MDYFNEVNHLVKRLEVNKRYRNLRDNSETLLTYWQVGKLLVKAQCGEKRAKYGESLIKEWSKKLTQEYGNGYKISNLKNMRNFYLIFKKSQPLVGQLNWSNIIQILPIKDENKRNYYINLCIERNLSKRELINEIKSNSYERLLERPEHIEIIGNKYETTNIKDYIKNPIIISLEKEQKIANERELQLLILARLKDFFSELGQGFTLVGNEYKIKYGNKNYYIDILLFNVEINSYVIVELKLRELKKEDKAQIEFYMRIVDETLKRLHHNKSIGIIVSKEQDKFIVNFVRSEEIIPITYKLTEKV